MTSRQRILVLIVVIMVAALILACGASGASYSTHPAVQATSESLGDRIEEKPTVVFLQTAEAQEATP